jgi:hypothetical protein
MPTDSLKNKILTLLQEQILDDRLKEYESGKMKLYTLEEVKHKLKMR